MRSVSCPSFAVVRDTVRTSGMALVSFGMTGGIDNGVGGPSIPSVIFINEA